MHGFRTDSKTSTLLCLQNNTDNSFDVLMFFSPRPLTEETDPELYSVGVRKAMNSSSREKRKWTFFAFFCWSKKRIPNLETFQTLVLNAQMPTLKSTQVCSPNSPKEHRAIGERSLNLFPMRAILSDYSPNNAHQTIEKNSHNLEKLQDGLWTREKTSSIDYTTPDIMQPNMKSSNLHMRKTNARLTNSLTMYEHCLLHCTRHCSGFQPDENSRNVRTRNGTM